MQWCADLREDVRASCRASERDTFADCDLNTMSCHRQRLVASRVLSLLAVLSASPIAHAQPALSTTTANATARIVTRIQPGPSDTWLFGRIQAIAVDRSGRIYVLDATDQKIRVFSQAGKPIRVLGGLGRGPGELFRPRTLDVVNDTLWVIDNANARLSAFSVSNGAYLRSSRAAVYDQDIEGVSSVGIFLLEQVGAGDASSGKPLTLRMTHERTTKSDRRQIGAVSIVQRSLAFRLYAGVAKQPSGTAMIPQPLDNGPLMRTSPHGRSFVVLDRSPRTTGAATTNVLGTGSSGAILLHEIGWRGDTVRRQMYTVPLRRLSATDVSAVIDSLANPNMLIMGAKPTGIPQEIRDSLYVPSHWPAVTEMIIGIDGSVWLRQPQPPAASAKFWRITPDGKEAAPVILPSSVRPFRVSLSRVWGVGENALGEPVVEVHDIVEPVQGSRKPGGGP